MSPREQILTIVRRALDRGQTVEIDGLGTFRPKPRGHGRGGYELVPRTHPQVFVAYVEEDLALARRLRDGIAAAGCTAWLDKDRLLPGQDWPRAIRRAVEISDAFVACFSPRSVAKRGQFHNELRWALECARLLPLEATFLVPVRFEACAVPRRIAEQVQYVDLFPDWDAGVKKVVRAVKTARRAGLTPGCRLINSN
jgi:TIR domain